MRVTDAEQQAMLRALTLATTPGVPRGPNPRVGCVLLSVDGEVVAEGFHRGAGTAHAEADALSRAGESARGATAVVTLEPCNHTGRMGPCAEALIASGVRRVVFAQRDPNPIAGGGADTLRAAGVEVVEGVSSPEAQEVNRMWAFAIEHGRPFVTWKFAATLDGRSAAADGTSRWVSSRVARQDTHRLRALCDCILVGTNTVEVDDPLLTVRDEQGRPVVVQPLRAVMGLRDLSEDRRVFDGSADTVRVRTHDPREALDQLFALNRQHVFLEGGPTLAAAFLAVGLIDEVVAYVAPMLLGSGSSAVADLGISSITQALHLDVTDVAVLGELPDVNLRLTMTPRLPTRKDP